MEWVIALASEIKGKTVYIEAPEAWWEAQFPTYKKIYSESAPLVNNRQVMLIQKAAIAINLFSK
jgi:hypothetical protein